MKKLHYTFIRFGKLGPVSQKGFNSEFPSIHSPPTRHGFYAFPIKSVEMFLVGGGYGGKSFEQKRRERKEFVKTQGTIWHHLEIGVKEKDIIERKGGWVKTTLPVWRKAYQKTAMRWMMECIGAHPTWGRSYKPFGIYARDNLEVYFDEKV